ncbi:MAG: AAA family ATPase [Roseicyclus sp.]|nr:AAA family ATPase [Roseicyclus sp.]
MNTPSDPISDDIDIVALFGVLWRAKWWIMLCGILGILAAGYYGTQMAVPMYPARATIALEGEGQQQVIADIESIFAGGGTDTVAINTEIEVLRSRTLIGRLVDELALVDDPEFNGISAEPGLLTQARMAVSDWEPGVVTDVALRNRVIDALIARISVSNIRQSLAFNIQIETTDPEKSALIVNQLAEIYIENQIRRKLDEATRAIEFLSLRTTELQSNVEMLEQGLAQRMEASDAIDTELLQAQNLQLRDLRARVADAGETLAEDRALLDAIGAAGGAANGATDGTPPETLTADNIAAIVDLIEASGDGRFGGIVQRIRAGRLSPEATEVALAGIVADLEDRIRRTQAQLRSLQGSAEELTAQIRVESDELIQMQQLDREVDAARLLYQIFLTRLQEASIQQGLETADARVLSHAVPRTASSPRVMMLMVLSGALAGFFGALAALIREWRFTGFRTTDELRSTINIPVLGSLPAMSVRNRRDVLQALKDKPNSIFAEAVRNLRTSILMANPDKEPQVILVTSSVPGEGKTTLSLALARYFGSLEGRRVLLVEADIRRQTLRAYVSDTREPGVQLIDVVLGKVRLDGLDLMDPDLGVEVLMGSDGDFNAADLFESRRFKELITNLRGRYHHIIIDSPPVLAVPDARVLTRYADLSVFAVRWSATSRTQVRQGLEMLGSVGHPADGVVLTQVDQRKMKNYGYAGQYGYDGYAKGYYTKE